MGVIQILRLTFAAIIVIVVTVIMAPPLILVGLFTPSGWPGYIVARMWCWIAAKALGISVEVRGAERADPKTSYIITPNHQSNLDIPALESALPTPYRWVIKKQLLKIPMFGWALGSTGAVSIDRSDKAKAVQTLREGASKLRDGWSLLIYPEGTRTSDGLLQRFKKGAFMMAVNTGVPILPVTINGAFKLWPKNSLRLQSGRISITIGEPIPTEGLTEADVPELMEKTRSAILKYLDTEFDPFAKTA
jgi:1-acyl-sn-glycerol-3-phosphate acyltransferase